MAIRETYVPISDACPVVLVDPANGDYYTLVVTSAGVMVNRVNGVPISNALPVVLVDPTVPLGPNFYKASGTTPGGSGFADQGREAVLAGATSATITFNVAGTDPIPVILYTTWASGAYISAISPTGITVELPVEVPVGGGTIGWAYVEA